MIREYIYLNFDNMSSLFNNLVMQLFVCAAKLDKFKVDVSLMTSFLQNPCPTAHNFQQYLVSLIHKVTHM